MYELSLSNFFTGKSFSEALILASTNPHYDNRLFMVIPGASEKDLPAISPLKIHYFKIFTASRYYF